MKASLQPTLPGRPGIGGLWEAPAGRIEKPGARFQLLAALNAAALGGRDRLRLRPACRQIQTQPLGTLGDQRGDRWSQALPIQAPQGPCAESAQPAVQGGRMRMVLAQSYYRLPQRDRRTIRGGIGCAGRLDDWPCVTLVRRDLHRQHAHPLLAHAAAALRHRRLPVLYPATPWPTRSSGQPSASPDQRANGATDRFAFDSRGLQGIIRDGDGSWDSTLSGTPRGTGVLAPVPHFLQKTSTLPPQPPPRKPLVHNPALMSMSFSVFSSGNPEPMRRVLPVSLRCH